MSVLADLGLEGVLDERTMRVIAKTLAVKMLDDKSSKGVMAGDVGGSRSASYYIPYLKKRMTLTSPGYSRGTTGTFNSRGYALLAPWDSSGEVARKSGHLSPFERRLAHRPGGGGAGQGVSSLTLYVEKGSSRLSARAFSWLNQNVDEFVSGPQ